jgi:SAM-dependent methyltransferase
MRRTSPRPPKRLPAAAPLHWHDAECEGYVADLPLWGELASEADSSVLELGCGAGRVLLYLARRDHEPWGVDSHPELVAAARRRASEADLRIEVREADARSLQLERRFRVCIASMQLMQVLPGPAARDAALRGMAEHLEPGGLAAATVIENLKEEEIVTGAVPDMREAGGWVYSSRPVALRRRGPKFEIERLREAVAPSGRLHRETHVDRLAHLSPDLLEEEARQAGLEPYDRRWVPAADAWREATAVILRRPG